MVFSKHKKVSWSESHPTSAILSGKYDEDRAQFLKSGRAAREYLDEKNSLSRSSLAEKHGVTIQSIRTAEEALKDPYRQGQGKARYFTDEDFFLVGSHVLDAAITSNCLMWKGVEAIFLTVRNANLETHDLPTVTGAKETCWKGTKTRFLDYWSRLGTLFKSKKGAQYIDIRRLTAEQETIPTFYYQLKALIEKYPEFVTEPGRLLNIDETPLVKQIEGKTPNGVVYVPDFEKGPKRATSSSCPAPATGTTAVYGDGEKGRLTVITQGKNPRPGPWIERGLPPGLTKEQIAQWVIWGYNEESDRVDVDSWLDLLANYHTLDHRRKSPTGELFWIVDCPTCHAVSNNSLLDGRIVRFAKANDVVFVLLPHNSTHR